MTKTEITLPGKILTSNRQKHVYSYYENSDSAKLFFKGRDSYSVSTWLNTKDAFIGNECISGSTPVEFKENIVVFDLSGKIIDTLYEAQKGEIAWPWYSSRNDKYLIFTSERNLDPEIYPLEALSPMVSLVIMDLEQKKVVVKIDSFGRIPNLKIKESPWLKDGYRFVYSMDGATQFTLQSAKQPINPLETKGGVYIFDIQTGNRTLLIPGGFSAIASSNSNSIAYEKDNCIIVRDLNNNKEQTLYKYKSDEVILTKHWTPDGKSIYFSYINRSSISDVYNKYGEKLIEVSSGKELPFKSIGMKYRSYTWK